MSTPDRQILIVDDDPTFLKYLSKSLPKPDCGFSVITAESGRKALELLAVHDIFMVISDIRMEKMSGIHLLGEIRSRYAHIKTILMTAYETENIKNQISESGCLKLLSKPVKADALREIVINLIKQQEQGFAGTLKNIQLTDIIQMCCYSEVNMAIRVTKGALQGTIYITGGDIVHATCNNQSGEAAFYEIMDWKSGHFETLGVDTIPEKTIDKNWEFLLIEASRKEDEQQVPDIGVALKEPHEASEAYADLGFELSDNDVATDPEEFEEETFLELFADELPQENDREAAPSETVDDARKIKILIVDDSSMMCKILADIFSRDDTLQVVGSAKNGEEALKQIEHLAPDLITLDVNMPIMDGSTALKHIMIKTPCPVVIISNPGKRSQLNILDFLRLGAVDFIKKPSHSGNMIQQHQEILETIHQAAAANTSNFRRARLPKRQSDQIVLKHDVQSTCQHLVVINSGSGGHGEVVKLLSLLSRQEDICVLILQKMPDEFMDAFSIYFNQNSEYQVLPLETQQPLRGGRCYIGSHAHALMLQGEEGGAIILQCNFDHQPFAEQSENADRLLGAIADAFTGQTTVIYLSGAVSGSLEGLAKIKSQQGHIIIQKSDECVVSAPLLKIKQAALFDQEAGLSDIARHISSS